MRKTYKEVFGHITFPKPPPKRPALAKNIPPLEARTCLCGCKKTFRVMTTSPMRYASQQCRYERGPEEAKVAAFLLGFIDDGAKSMALFSAEAPLVVGDGIEGFRFDGIDGRYVLLSRGVTRVKLLAGDYIEESRQRGLVIRSGLEQQGDTLLVTTQLRDYVAETGLVQILMQAAAEPALDADGVVLGYRLFEIDEGSIYRLAGLENGDVVTAIDGAPITTPFQALRALASIKRLEQFTFGFTRGGKPERRKVIVK